MRVQTKQEGELAIHDELQSSANCEQQPARVAPPVQRRPHRILC